MSSLEAVPVSDEALVEEALGGNVGRFEPLMRRYNQRLYRIIVSVLRDDAEAEDALQDTYLSAFAQLRSLEKVERVSAWLCRIAYNTALMRLRKKKRSPIDPAVEIDDERAANASAGPEDAVAGKELSRWLQAAIRNLPDGQREVLMLRAVEGLSVADTAATMGVSEDVVKTRLFRARAGLHEQLEDGLSLDELFVFHAPRCNRVVEGVLRRLQSVH